MDIRKPDTLAWFLQKPRPADIERTRGLFRLIAWLTPDLALTVSLNRRPDAVPWQTSASLICSIAGLSNLEWSISSSTPVYPSWAAQAARRQALRTANQTASHRGSRAAGDGYVDLMLLIAATGPIPRLLATFALARLRQCVERRAYRIVQRSLAAGILEAWPAEDDRVGSVRTLKDLLSPGWEWDTHADRLDLPSAAVLCAAVPRKPGAHLLGMALLQAATGAYTVHADGDFLGMIERMPRGGPLTSRVDTINRQRSGLAPSPHTTLVPGSLLGAVPAHSHAPYAEGVTEPSLLFLGDGATTERYLRVAMPHLRSHGPFTVCVSGEAALGTRQALYEEVDATLNRVKTLGQSTVVELGGRTTETRARYFAETRDAVALCPLNAPAIHQLRANLERLVLRHMPQGNAPR